MEEVALAGHEVAAQKEEASCDLAVSGEIEAVGDQGAIPRPQVGIRVAVETQDVGVVRRDDRAAVVDLGADHERGALVEVADPLGKMRGDGFVLVRPEPPVILRTREE